MTSKRPLQGVEIDLTNEADVKRLRKFEVTLQDLPNELLINVLKERSAREYLVLSSTSKALAQRLQQIDNDLFRYYLQRDFNELISRDLDARTAYVVRARLPILRFFELTKLSESTGDYDLFGRYFFRPAMTMDLHAQIATILEKIYPKSIGIAREVTEDDEEDFHVDAYELSISEQLDKKENAWVPRISQVIGGNSIAQIVRKLRTIDLVDESDNVIHDRNSQPQMLTFHSADLNTVNDDGLFRAYLQRDFDQAISASLDSKTAYLMWQWHLSPHRMTTHVVTVWQGYHREEPDEIIFKLFSVPKGASLRTEAARALVVPSDDRPDAILLRHSLQQYEALVSDDITKYLEEIGDTLDLPPIDERYNLAVSEHVMGHTIGEIIQKLNVH